MKAIIFDMGGVLVDLDVEACKDAFRKELEFYEIDQILDACHQTGVVGEMEVGNIDEYAFRDYVIAHSRPGITGEDIDNALHKILVSIAPYKFDLLRKLSEKYDIYMLSNNNPIATKRAGQMFREGGFTMEDDFKKCYISYQMKMLKPSAEFYKAVIEDVALPAEEMLFIDDSQKNVDAAIAAGLPAIYYEPSSDLAELLAKYVEY